MTAALVRGNALRLPFGDGTVDLIVTSPPYFGLRQYTDSGRPLVGQVGAEATPAEFLDALIAATAEMVRVLKPSGSIWVNLGDKYAQNTERSRNGHGGALDGGNPLRSGPSYIGRRDNGVPVKSLIGLPWRYAIRCIDELGLILRRDQIWSKPNGLPESVTDRCRSSHEYWFHFTKEPRYFSAVDEIREAFADDRPLSGMSWDARRGRGDATRQGQQTGTFGGNGMAGNPLGKLPGSVWTIPTQPLNMPPEIAHATCCDGKPADGCQGDDHYAAFPFEWPRRIIRGWSPRGICTACGEGRRPVAVNRPEQVRAPYMGRSARADASEPSGNARGFNDKSQGIYASRVTITGYACACPGPTAPTRPAVVLDPFGGTGTTSLVADVEGRHGISHDLSAGYLRGARWRTTDPGERARAMQVEKPPPVPADMDSLLDLLDLDDLAQPAREGAPTAEGATA